MGDSVQHPEFWMVGALVGLRSPGIMISREGVEVVLCKNDGASDQLWFSREARFRLELEMLVIGDCLVRIG